jgi:hypothetical protein
MWCCQAKGSGTPSADPSSANGNGTQKSTTPQALPPFLPRCLPSTLPRSRDRLCRVPYDARGSSHASHARRALLRLQPRMRTPKGTPGQRPRMLICYICGREYGSASLPIHEAQCIKRFEVEQVRQPVRSSVQIRTTAPRANAGARFIDRARMTLESQRAPAALPNAFGAKAW